MVYKSILGQERIKDILKRVLQEKRLGHAYLLIGSEGTQKEQMSLAFGQSLLCHSPLHGEACENCPSCLSFAKQQHPDFLHLKPEGKLRVISKTAIDRLAPFVSMKAFYEGRKIIFIDGADRMNPSASNSILKVLEEPPAGTLFILTCSKESSLLPTIRSRTIPLFFPPLSLNQVEDWLNQENPPPSTPSLLARLSEGYPEKVNPEKRDSLLEKYNKVIEFIERWLQRGTLEVIEWVDLILEEKNALEKQREKEVLGEIKERFSNSENTDLRKKMESEAASSINGELKQFLEEYLHLINLWFRDLFILEKGFSQEGLYFKEKADLLSRSTLKTISPSKGLLLIDDSRRVLQSNANPKMVLESLFLSLFSGQVSQHT